MNEMRFLLLLSSHIYRKDLIPEFCYTEYLHTATLIPHIFKNVKQVFFKIRKPLTFIVQGPMFVNPTCMQNEIFMPVESSYGLDTTTPQFLFLLAYF